MDRFQKITEKIRNKRGIDGQVEQYLAMHRIEIERRKTTARKKQRKRI